MPLPESSELHPLCHRHVHDVRNHCAAIDLDATLLGELSEDPEMVRLAEKFQRQAARIGLELKLFLAKLEPEPRVPMAPAEIIQLWRSGLEPFGASQGVSWPDHLPDSAVLVERNLVMLVLADLILRVRDRNSAAALIVRCQPIPGGLTLEIRLAPGLPFPLDYLRELEAVLGPRGMGVQWAEGNPQEGLGILLSLENAA